MYTRVVDCTLKPGKQLEFNTVLREKVLPVIKNETGFVTLLGFVSDDRAEHALAITIWKTRDDALRFYRNEAPMRDFLGELASEPPKVEHYDLDPSMVQFLAAGKAA